MERRLLCLRELPLFQGLAEADFYDICPGIVNKSIARGQFLFRQGEQDHSVYLIKAGKVKLVQNTEDGREIIINIVGPGEVIGETTLFQGNESPFSAVALESVSLCCFNRRQFESIIQNNPPFAVKIIGHLAGKLNSTMQ